MENKKFYNVRDLIENAIKQYPDNVAFKLKEKNGKKVKYTNITYKKMQKDIFALGTAINSLNKKEKRVAIIGKNSYPWILSYLATFYGNNVVVPLDKGLPDTEIKDLLERSKANIVIFEDKYIDVMKQIKTEKIGSVKHFICMEDNTEHFKTLVQLMEDGKKEMKSGNKKIMSMKIDDKNGSNYIYIWNNITCKRCNAISIQHSFKY